MQKNPTLCKADYLQNDLSMAKQEVDFELLAAVEASEAEGKMKENEMRIAHRLTSAHEKKSGNRFVDGERDGECLPRSVLYADGKLACVDHDEEKKLIQEQRREIVEHVKQNLTASLDESAHDFLEKKRDIDRHCENMSKAGALMGELELQAVADIRGASVKVRGLLLP